MTIKRVHYLITKFLSDKLSELERQQLEQLLQDPDNKALFDEVVKANFAADYSLGQYNSEPVKKLLLDKIRKDKSIFYRKRFISTLKYAAVAVLFIGIGYFFKDSLFTSGRTSTQIVVKDDVITLELDNGETKILNPSNVKVVQNEKGEVIGKQNKNVIQYSDNIQIETLVYNTLKVPYGKQFDLILSDGTKVFMNSGTSLKYPIKFLKGHKREVFITGEALFDVEEDKDHPFVVNAKELDVTVLGTEFVVSLYEEDKVTSVVLVEGSVDMSTNGNGATTRLTPGNIGVLDNYTGEISKNKINTNFYTAWIDGILIFRKMSFDTIAKKLERVYNVTIVSRNSAFSNEVFNASFDNEPIENILSYFKDSYNMDYSIEDNVIYIN